ncbi:hypothetical protein BDV28DRAFT_150902 [Aspergillus coremiiformis]|uniref:F-box domain-containing protein n=1 Tax=Aspergillus coremiiformis TaxID=138285 RepID=A0A5N6YZ60_9EURO|nr:hypothetical protein BDV28DRAFT_150902 [Aspergillus coremiiformis]
MDSLSQELLLLIIPYLRETPPNTLQSCKPPLKIASYATISRQWQHAIERFTLSTLHTYSSDLLTFRQVFALPRRRKTLRRLHYEIDLPAYSANRIACFERRRESKANEIAFHRGLADLFHALSKWDKQGLELTLTTSSPTDPSHLTWPKPKNPALQIEHRHGPSHAKPRRKEQQLTKVPKALSTALDVQYLPHLQSLTIHLDQSIPRNHNFKPHLPDPSYPAGDTLNLAIKALAETSPLSHLHLTGDWPISPALFTDATFPHLRDLKIEAALLTYDGRWYYDGDPSATEPCYESRRLESESESDSDSNSSFNSEYADYVNERREAVLNGNEPWYMWRKEPGGLFDGLVLRMAEAMGRMACLQKLVFSMGTEYFDYGVVVEAWKEVVDAGCEVRLMGEVKWEVPDGVLALWRESVGEVSIEAY